MRRQRKMTAHSLLPFPKCSVSSEWAISFSCGHPHKYFNCVSLFLQCKLEQQACLTGKDLSIMCAGFCPCSTASIANTNTDAKRGKFPFVHHLLSSFCDSHLLVSFSRIKVSKKRKSSRAGGHTKHDVSRTPIFSQTQSTRCSAFGINTHQFQRLLLSKYPPCGQTALSIMW